MDPNHLLRMRTTPIQQGNNGWQENRYGSISPESAPADMIRMSFDQIYRATPVNPLLAQQLRRQQQLHQSPMVYPVIPSPLQINPSGTMAHYQSPYVSPSVTNNTAPLGGMHNMYFSPSNVTTAAMHSPNSIHGTAQRQQNQQSSNSSTFQTMPDDNPQREPSQLISRNDNSAPLTKISLSQKSSPRVPPTVQPVNLSHDAMPPPPPMMAGGSRTKRGASTVDSLLAMKAVAIPISVAQKNLSANIHISVSTSHQPAPPSSSSTQNPPQNSNVRMTNVNAEMNIPQNRPNDTKRSRKSYPSHQPMMQAKIESPPAPKTITRSGRVCKPVNRIIEEMDNPASNTSYSAIRRLSFNNKPDFSQEEIQASAVSLQFEESGGEIMKDNIAPLNNKKNAQHDEEYVPNQTSVLSKEVAKSKKRQTTDSKKQSKEASVGEKLRALMAEADGEPYSEVTKDMATQPASSVSKDKSLSQKKSSQWLPTEVVALYAVYNKTDVTLPNFWQVVSEKLKQEKNVLRSEEECKEKWFAALVDMNKRQEKMIQKKKQTQVDQALQKLQTINEQTAIMLGTKAPPPSSQSAGTKPPVKGGKKNASTKNTKNNRNPADETNDAQGNDDNAVEEEGHDSDNSPDCEDLGPANKVKRPRLGKNDMKVLAEHSSKALREDDAFESEAFRKQMQQHQEQRKTSAVARFLQQQALRRSPFPSPPVVVKTGPSPAAVLSGDTPTARRLSAVLGDAISSSMANRSLPIPEAASPVVSSVIMSPSTVMNPGMGNETNSINILSVRRKSNMSLSQQQSPALSGTTSITNTTPIDNVHKPTTTNNILFSPVETPTTNHIQPFRHRVAAIDPTDKSNNMKRKLNVFDEENEDEDLFNSRVVQKIKRVRPQPQLLFASSHNQSLGPGNGMKKKAKKSATKELSSAEEISKQYNHELRKIQGSSDEEEEQEINSDDDDDGF